MDPREFVYLLILSVFSVLIDNIYCCVDEVSEDGTKIPCCSGHTQLPGINVSWPPAMDGQLHFTESVALGKVISKMDANEDGLYSVEFKVDCSYLKQIPRTVKIINAGKNPKTCHNVEFKVGSGYFVFINHTAAGYVTTFDSSKADTYEEKEQITDELAITCGMQSFYPTGLSADKAKVNCDLETEGPEYCQKYEDRHHNVVPPTPRMMVDGDTKYEVDETGKVVQVDVLGDGDAQSETVVSDGDGGKPPNGADRNSHTICLLLASLVTAIGLKLRIYSNI